MAIIIFLITEFIFCTRMTYPDSLEVSLIFLLLNKLRKYFFQHYLIFEKAVTPVRTPTLITHYVDYPCPSIKLSIDSLILLFIKKSFVSDCYIIQKCWCLRFIFPTSANFDKVFTISFHLNAYSKIFNEIMQIKTQKMLR